MLQPSDSNVVYLDDYRPHVVGIVKCSACGYEWVGVVPASAQGGLECSECGEMKGEFV